MGTFSIKLEELAEEYPEGVAVCLEALRREKQRINRQIIKHLTTMLY